MGPPGTGKSTFLNSNPHLLILDPDRGGRTVADPKAMRFTPPPNTDPAQLDKAYLSHADLIIARKLKGATDIKMLGVDSLDEMIGIFQTALCLREGQPGCSIGDICGGHGKGYFLVREAIFGMLDKAYRAGLGWAIAANIVLKAISVGGQEIQRSGLAVSDSYKGATQAKCEHMMFIEHGIQTIRDPDTFKTVVGKKIKVPGKSRNIKVRKLKTRPGGLWQGGDTNEVKVRVPLKDEYILPELGGWDLFVEAYEEACDLLTNEKNNVYGEQR